MPSVGVLRREGRVRTDVSEEPSASINRVSIIGELGTTLAVTSNRRTSRKNTMYFNEPPDSITFGQCNECLNNCQLVYEDSDPWSLVHTSASVLTEEKRDKI
jgi:hypothetical protein